MSNPQPSTEPSRRHALLTKDSSCALGALARLLARRAAREVLKAEATGPDAELDTETSTPKPGRPSP